MAYLVFVMINIVFIWGDVLFWYKKSLFLRSVVEPWFSVLLAQHNQLEDEHEGVEYKTETSTYEGFSRIVYLDEEHDAHNYLAHTEYYIKPEIAHKWGHEVCITTHVVREGRHS